MRFLLPMNLRFQFFSPNIIFHIQGGTILTVYTKFNMQSVRRASLDLFARSLVLALVGPVGFHDEPNKNKKGAHV